MPKSKAKDRRATTTSNHAAKRQKTGGPIIPDYKVPALTNDEWTKVIMVLRLTNRATSSACNCQRSALRCTVGGHKGRIVKGELSMQVFSGTFNVMGYPDTKTYHLNENLSCIPNDLELQEKPRGYDLLNDEYKAKYDRIYEAWLTKKNLAGSTAAASGNDEEPENFDLGAGVEPTIESEFPILHKIKRDECSGDYSLFCKITCTLAKTDPTARALKDVQDKHEKLFLRFDTNEVNNLESAAVYNGENKRLSYIKSIHQVLFYPLVKLDNVIALTATKASDIELLVCVNVPEELSPEAEEELRKHINEATTGMTQGRNNITLEYAD